ncbi:hypothetical protein PoB_004281500 [Plakobranchus ocellatus]|uniref:Uncharacterized protein n=1 Tax=Plakobranchus ocellatus TaxID=259542 RepID=A0AAV4B9W3_9GAST|nr:hypothetical protein PoB_004281500 [Plakobranchus ocellatus]
MAALNKASYSGKLKYWSDLKPKVNAYIHTVWQENWDTDGANKLHKVFRNLGEDFDKRDKGAGRKRETVMCRFLKRHTGILIEYPDCQVIRRKYFSLTDLYTFPRS